MRTLFVLPIALALALLGGAVPAWQATRGTPLGALRPPVRGGAHARVHSSGLALVNLARVPLRTALGASGLVLGVAALTIIVAIERTFQGTLVSTLLGNAISLQVRGSDFVALGLTIGLAAVSAADVLYLNLRERAAEFVTLGTTGWSPVQLGRVVFSRPSPSGSWRRSPAPLLVSPSAAAFSASPMPRSRRPHHRRGRCALPPR